MVTPTPAITDTPEPEATPTITPAEIEPMLLQIRSNLLPADSSDTPLGIVDFAWVEDGVSGIAEGTIIQIDGKSFVVGRDVFGSIQEAADAVISGGTIMVSDGIYRKNVVLTKPVTIKGVNKDTVFIIGTIVVMTDKANINGLSVNYNRTSTGETGVWVRSMVDASTITISDCRFVNSGGVAQAYAILNGGKGELDASTNDWSGKDPAGIILGNVKY